MGRRRIPDREPTIPIAISKSSREYLDRYKRGKETIDKTIKRLLSQGAKAENRLEKIDKIIKAYHRYWKQIYDENIDSHDWKPEHPDSIKIMKWFIDQLQKLNYEEIRMAAIDFKKASSISGDDINKSIRLLYRHIEEIMDDEDFPFSHRLNEMEYLQDNPPPKLQVTIDEVYCFLFHCWDSRKFFVRETPEGDLVVDLFTYKGGVLF
jgi:hypothetical protein